MSKPQQSGLIPGPQRQVSKAGISSTGHIVHAILTLFTYGCCGIVWGAHWPASRNMTATTTPPNYYGVGRGVVTKRRWWERVRPMDQQPAKMEKDDDVPRVLTFDGAVTWNSSTMTVQSILDRLRADRRD